MFSIFFLFIINCANLNPREVRKAPLACRAHLLHSVLTVSSLALGETENLPLRSPVTCVSMESHIFNFFFVVVVLCWSCQRRIEFVFVFSSPSYFSIPVFAPCDS